MTPPIPPMPQVAIFARRPRAGMVKTRLARSVGVERAAALYAAFLADTVDHCRRFAPESTWLFVAPERELWPHGVWPGAVPSRGARVRLQTGRDLGERLSAAFAVVLERGPAVIVGSDAPDLPAGTFERAFRILARRDVVVGPCRDGGYYLVGVRSPVGDLFDGIDWSTERVLAQTFERASRRRLTVGLLQMWRDVDEASDLEALALRLARARRRGAPVPPRTAALLGIGAEDRDIT